MPRLVPVTREGHSQKRWRRNEGYAFAASESVVPLVATEFSNAAVAMPIAFIERSERFVPVAVLSLTPGRNLFVGPAGQWLGRYIPASLRAYPFRFARIEGGNDPVLCIDEDAGLIVDADDQAEQFFAPDGGPSAAIQLVWRLLMELEASRTRTELAVSALASAGVIQPWQLKINLAGQEKAVTGLYRVDEATINALDDEFIPQIAQVERLASSLLTASVHGAAGGIRSVGPLAATIGFPATS